MLLAIVLVLAFSGLADSDSDHVHRALDTGIEQPQTALLALRESLSSVNTRSIGVPAPASMEAATIEADPWENDVLPKLPKEAFALAF